MSPTCDYSETGDASCRGTVTLVEETDTATGDRVVFHACEGHVPPEYSEAEVPLWDDVPASFFLTDDL